jgi:hypothetical protein
VPVQEQDGRVFDMLRDGQLNVNRFCGEMSWRRKKESMNLAGKAGSSKPGLLASTP